MPVAAAGLAEVGAGDPHPLVLGGGGEHTLEQLAVARLQLGPAAQRPPRLRGPRGERVAHPLELGEAGDPRPRRRRGDGDIDLEPREGLGPQPRQLPLQPPDLAPQLGAGEPLVAPDLKPAEPVSFEQIRHLNPARV